MPKQIKKDILCDKKGCEKVIGYVGYNDSPHYFDGTHQTGYKSACCKKHLKESFNPPKKLTLPK